MERTKRDAYTIHQFLIQNNWINPKNFALRYRGGAEIGAPTVIIDEASMIPMDLLGVLFGPLTLNKVSRLILWATRTSYHLSAPAARLWTLLAG